MSMESSFDKYFFRTACWFEVALTPLAWGLGWLCNIEVFDDLHYSESAMANGFLATLPLVMLFFAMQQATYRPLIKIRELLLETLGARLQDRQWSDLLILAAIAGFSEEVLFRGFIQPWAEQQTDITTGLIISNLVFALLHAVTPLYAVLAFLMGIYLGLSLDYGEERNLMTPTIIHGVYDFVAFLAIVRSYRLQI